MRTHFFFVFLYIFTKSIGTTKPSFDNIEYIFIEKREDKRKWETETWIWKFNYWWSNLHVSFHFLFLSFISIEVEISNFDELSMLTMSNVDPYVWYVREENVDFSYYLSMGDGRIIGVSESTSARTPNSRVPTEIHFPNGKMLRVVV